MRSRPSHQTDLVREVWRTWAGDEDADLFRAGGDSVTAVRMAADLAAVLGISVRAADVLRYATAAEFERAVALAGPPSRAAGGPTAAREPDGRSSAPVTVGQEHMWLAQTALGGSFYTQIARIVIAGPLDIDALTFALTGILTRHEALRTRFRLERGGLRQQTAPYIRFAFDETDLTGHPADARHRAVRDAVRAEQHRTFDLSAGSLFAAHLLVISPDRSLLVISTHHLVFDGWSRDVLVRDLDAAYRAGGRPPRPIPALRYVDYCTWQREQLAAGRFDEQLARWRDRLAPPLPRFPNTTDTADDFRSATVRATVGPAAAAAVHLLASERRSTTFMVLLATYAVALRDEVGLHDIVVATLSANRSWPCTGDLVGFLANTVVIRVRLSADDDLASLLPRVREATLEAYEDADVPFETVLAACPAGPDDDEHALVRVGFALHMQHAGVVDGTRLRATDRFDEELVDDPGEVGADCYELDPTTFAVTAEFRQSDTGFEVKLQHKPIWVAPATAERVLARLEQVLQAAGRPLEAT